MAFLRFAVFEEGGRTLGQRILPVSHLQPGHKHIVLRNCWNKPLGLATLFVHIDVQERVGSVRRKPSRAVENPTGAMSLLISELKLLQEADAIVRLEELTDVETKSQARRLAQRGQC
ncbi:1-phosphatidylinositol-4,5-bisphosphate phosphodiesterase beta-1 [Aphelenchoides avenae]|nr:1-phosphatidylinositol-4,5-bisphosphate phosphodiesterase beta-1 [Aphelenchus avenae]